MNIENEVITESRAWEIINEYVNDLLRIDNHGVLAVYAIGSLGGGYYRPGKSDIDTFVIVRNDAVITQEIAEPIAARYYQHFHIPKGFGTIVVTEKELFPPYQKSEKEEFEFTIEIVRLKLQGKAAYSNYDLRNVPMPAKNDFIHDAVIMENWFDREFGKEMFQPFDAEGCVNSILWYVRRYLMIEKGVFILNKFHTIDAYINNEPPIADYHVFSLIHDLLHEYEATEQDVLDLRCFGNQLRLVMNERLLNRKM